MNSEQAIFEIIANAGDARDLTYQALDQVAEGNIEKAFELVEQAEKTMDQAHNAQTKLIQQEIQGEKVDGSLLMVHAQDHLMTAISEHQMVKRMLPIFKKLMKAEAK
ncbi:PTS system, cellobiose-specific IIA component [Amphibacillus marinus]|uniref:PTS system, cellobiose-specific IIA component n=1 Tax=Amphibacillus marinus TaxID=872970 RepID=A0A1H8QQW9_9BACI|nr:PTS lactose/cellobiose transporter subunit IIA [Amphibacillus marinus]SEO56605.1 PTS system, cellobiose-specific IIA component [Amphibacillus marinus]